MDLGYRIRNNVHWNGGASRMADMGMTDQQIIVTLATKVMKWELKLHDHAPIRRSYWVNQAGEFQVWADEWNPLQNIADAWQVVEKLESMEMAVEIYTETYAPRNCKIWHDGIEIAEEEGETAQEAICKAALEVVD